MTVNIGLALRTAIGESMCGSEFFIYGQATPSA